MNYEEIYKKAQAELTQVKLQEARVQSQVESLLEELGIPKPEEFNAQELLDQLSKMKEEYEANQKEVITKLDKYIAEYNELAGI